MSDCPCFRGSTKLVSSIDPVAMSVPWEPESEVRGVSEYGPTHACPR
jgi:hypothetical protein